MSTNEPSRASAMIFTEFENTKTLNQIWGEKIKEIRIFKNLTQEELAQRVGVVRKSIFSLEKGHGRFELFVKVMETLDMGQLITDTLSTKFDDDIENIKRIENMPIIIAKRKRVR